MATLTAQDSTDSGADLTFLSASGGGDQFLNASNTLLIVKNDDASSKDVTVTAQSTSVNTPGYGTTTKADTVHTVAAGAVAIIGTFGSRAFNDSDGFIQVTYSAVTSLTVAVLKTI